MSARSRIRTWFRALGGRASMETEMDAELRFHVEAYADDLMRQANNNEAGRKLAREEALRLARLKFGTLDHAKEECREALGVSMLENLMQDLRFAFRTMGRSPGFTAIAILSLGLGIGANTAIFTLINQLMLKSLPVRDPQSLVALGKQIDGGITDGLSGSIDLFPYEFYQKLQQNDEAFRELTTYASGGAMQVTVRRSGTNGVTTARAHLVAGNYFDVLGVVTQLGRPLQRADDNGAQSRAVAVISDHYWREKFSQDPNAIGQSIAVNSVPVTIVGVAAPGFFGERVEDSPADVWLPLGLQPQVMSMETLLGPRGLFWLQIMGRTKPGVSRAQAQQWVTMQLRSYVLAREGDAASDRKREIENMSVEIVPAATGVSILRAQYQEPLRILMCVVAVVLLIACANLANFLMAKTLAREHEIATRLALGAGRWRIVRQMLTESLVLSFSGGLLGLLLAYWGTEALIAFVSQGATFTPIQASPDPRVLAFSFGVSLITGVLFGIGPALRVSHVAMESGIKSSARTAAGGGTGATRLVPRILITAQVALSLGLLVGAGLFLRTLRNLENRNFGFERSNLLVGQVEAKIAGYKSEKVVTLYGQILDRIDALPGVQSATISTSPPMSLGSWMCPVIVKGRETQPQDQNLSVLNGVTPGYFQTLGIGLKEGRFLELRDAAGTPKAVVFNEKLERELFPKGGAIGQRVTFGDPAVDGDWEIVGVVNDTLYDGPREAPRKLVYFSVDQLRGDDRFVSWLQVRTTGDPERSAASVRAALSQIDPDLPVPSLRTIREHVAIFTSRETLISKLSIFFALLALLLVCVGLYGVMTYSVVRRTNEIGIRMALGAQQRGVFWMILRESMVVLVVGVAIGLPATLAAMRLVQSGLFGLSPSDPLTLSVAVAVVAGVTLFASYLPARRATKVDPMVALRYE